MTAYNVYWTRTIHGVKVVQAENPEQARELFYSVPAYVEDTHGDNLELTVQPVEAKPTLDPNTKITKGAKV